MSTTVDNRVVEMKFDNKHFESNVQTSMSTLDKLKRSLNLSGASKGLENVNAAAKNCDMSVLSRGVETVQARFSALQVMGVTALANITNSAVNAGKRIVSALTIDPIKTGFDEYELKMNSVQTIMSNTASKGTTMSDVTRTLDELNTYADKTIYNFAEMTRNIGTFTAAGVGLKESASAIQGIANLAAASGSSSQQASTAMYQLSQALAAGTVKLMDWNSVVNAGMGGEKFQEALKATAREHGVAVDSIIEKNGSFRDSLQDGWLSADILNETLNKFTVDGAKNYAKSMMESGKWTQEQADALIKEAQAMEDAATKVKTFTQLWDTLKEAAQSGWSQSWEIIVGDFEEAKELFSEISDVLGGMIGSAADARNEVLKGWKDLGGRTALIDALRNAFEGVMSIVKPLTEAFREIFPPITAQQLTSFSEGLRDLTAKLKVSEGVSEKLKSTFKGMFAVLDIVRQAVVAVFKAFSPLFDGFGSFGDKILTVTAAFGDWLVGLNSAIKASGSFEGALEPLSNFMKSVSNAVKDFMSSINIDGIGDVFSKIFDTIGNAFGKVKDVVGDVFTWLADNISAGDIFAGLAGGGIFILIKKFGKLIDKVKEIFENFKNHDSLTSSFSEVLGSVKDSLESFQNGVKVASIVAIAVSIGILSHALRTISEIEPGKIVYSLGAIGVMLLGLTASFGSMSKALSKFNPGGMIRAGISIIGIAVAINILASAMKKIADLDLPGIMKGLAGIGGLLIELSIATRIIGKSGVNLRTSIAIIALAQACRMLGDALKEFGSMAWDEIARGLTAMGGALAELSLVLAVLSKVGGGGALLGSAAILIVSQALDEIAENLKRLGEMSWDEIGRGLTAMGGALAELGAVLAVLSKVGGGGALLGGTAILIATQALDEISENLKRLGSMSWEEIGKGLTAMGGALAELGIVVGALGKIAGLSGLAGAASILIGVQALGPLADALQKFGSMSWEEIGRGLVAMGGALLELGVIVGLLGTIAPIGSLLGAGAILLGVQGLGDLADALKKFGSMSWEEIGRGLVAMGGALLELGVISGLLGTLAPIGAMVGSGSLLLAIQGLDDLAEALKKFGSMSWDEIGRGLTAMGAAMGETAIGGLLNTFSGFGASAISEMAGSLGTLADSIKKWSGVTVPENLGKQLGSLAAGVMKFTFGGFGAGAISTVAEPLGTLADSVSKWSGVTVPDGLGDRIGSLANGVEAFTFSGIGAGALSSAAPGVGDMADAVSKWANVTIPEGLEDGLKSIANGVQAFSFAFAGGWSIDAIKGPLGDLAGTVTKWNGVSVPSGIKDGLTNLADGVKAFSFAFVGGWSIDAIKGPLGDLADSVKKWNDVYISGIGSSLERLADGLKALEGVKINDDISSFLKSFSGEHIATAITNINNVVTAIGNLARINPSTISTFSTALSDLGKVSIDGLVRSLSGGASRVGTAVNGIVSAMQASLMGSGASLGASAMAAGVSMMAGLAAGISGASSMAISSALSTVSIIAASMQSSQGRFMAAGLTLMSQFAAGIMATSSAVQSVLVAIIGMMLARMNSARGQFQTTGVALMIAFVAGLRAGCVNAANAVSGLMESIVSAIQGFYGSFYRAGGYLGEGLTAGISAQEQAAYNAGYKLGEAAVQGEKDGQQSHSPSRATMRAGKWLGEGLIIGMDRMGKSVYGAGESMGQNAVDSISGALDSVSNVMSSDMDIQPSIRPVVDMSNIESRSGGFQLSANVNAVLSKPIDSLSQLMANSQNEINASNNEVITAINGLREDINALYSSESPEIGLYVDSKKLASTMVKPLSYQLSMLSRRGG